MGGVALGAAGGLGGLFELAELFPLVAQRLNGYDDAAMLWARLLGAALPSVLWRAF